MWKLLSALPWFWSLFFSELTFQLPLNLSPPFAREFQCVVAHTEAHDPAFVVSEVHGARLAYYHHPDQPSSELLVIPPGGGLH